MYITRKDKVQQEAKLQFVIIFALDLAVAAYTSQ